MDGVWVNAIAGVVGAIFGVGATLFSVGRWHGGILAKIHRHDRSIEQQERYCRLHRDDCQNLLLNRLSRLEQMVEDQNNRLGRIEDVLEGRRKE